MTSTPETLPPDAAPIDMLRHLVASDAFAEEPVTLVDIGCGNGINVRWREFGKHLRGVGVDPQIDECERLAGVETHPRISYHAALFGLQPDDPFHARRAKLDPSRERYFAGYPRSSTWWRVQTQAAGRSDDTSTRRWTEQRLASARLDLGQLAGLEHLTYCDFVKTDTDGSDLEAVLACERSFHELCVLGLLVECPFDGSDAAEANSFHNIDRTLRRNGFALFALTRFLYSRAALPARFVLPVTSNTISGQIVWGDALYFRDAASPSYLDVWPEPLPPLKLLKLAALFELFGLPDCAAEILIAHRDALNDHADTAVLLDLLTPLGPDGRHIRYADYVSEFELDPRSFYPAPAAPASPHEKT